MWGREGAWCLSWWQRDPVGTAWSKQVAPQPGQAPGPLIHSTPPLVPTGPWAASISMARIPRFGRQHSSGLDLAGGAELSSAFEPCLRYKIISPLVPEWPKSGRTHVLSNISLVFSISIKKATCMSLQFGLTPSQKRHLSVRATLETGMILAGVVATLFLLPRRGFYDGDVRFNAMVRLIDHCSMSRMHHSIAD